MDFPLTIATVPYRSSQSQVYSVTYDFSSEDVETGKYVSPEFTLGHVYDGNGNDENAEDIILYRPVYVKVVEKSQASRTRDILDSQLSESPASLRKAEKNGSQKSVNTLNTQTAAIPSVNAMPNSDGGITTENTKLI
jgi:hypothetical protein